VFDTISAWELNSALVNADPLSVTMTSGRQNVAKMRWQHCSAAHW